MKKAIKMALATSFLTLALGMSSMAAYNSTNELADAINKTPDTFYTLYSGMPISDYQENWYGIKGWKQKRNWDTKYSTQDEFTRTYKIDGVTVKERVTVSFSKDLNVFAFGVEIQSDNPKIIEKIYNRLYDNACANYPEFSSYMKRGWTSPYQNPKPCYVIEKTRAYDKYIGLHMSERKDVYKKTWLSPKYVVDYHLNR